VEITVVVGSRGRMPDPHNLTKTLHDSLTKCGAIHDDSQEYLDAPQPVVIRGDRKTIIVITNV